MGSTCLPIAVGRQEKAAQVVPRGITHCQKLGCHCPKLSLERFHPGLPGSTLDPAMSHSTLMSCSVNHESSWLPTTDTFQPVPSDTIPLQSHHSSPGATSASRALGTLSWVV